MDEPRIVAAAANMTTHGDFGQATRGELLQQAHDAVVRKAMDEGLSLEKDAAVIVARKIAMTTLVLEKLDEAERVEAARLAEELASAR